MRVGDLLLVVVLVSALTCCTSALALRFNQTALGDSFDWRTKGVIPHVRNQGQIGDSLSVVLAEGVESLLAIKTGGNVPDLSVDEVADCCVQQRLPLYRGYDCIKAIGGLCAADKYKSHTGRCQNETCAPLGKVSGTVYIPAGRADAMVSAIHQTPLSAYLYAGLTSFQIYRGGVYSSPKCPQHQLDHVVLIVGYGTLAGQNYWTIQNSWGPEWGEAGYMRIARGNNMCGIESKVFYPIN